MFGELCRKDLIVRAAEHCSLRCLKKLFAATVDKQVAPGVVLYKNHGRRIVDDRLQPRFCARSLNFYPLSLGRNRDMRCYCLSDLELVRGAFMGLAVIEHELAKDAAI